MASDFGLGFVGEEVGDIFGNLKLAAVGDVVEELATLRRAGFDAGAGAGAGVGAPIPFPELGTLIDS